MNCREIQEKIVLFEELDEKERKLVLEHIKVCEECRRFYREEKRLKEMLKRVRVERKLRVRRVAITAFAVMATLLTLLLTFKPHKAQFHELIISEQKNAVVKVLINGR